MRTIPKTWKKTAYEKAAIWSLLENASIGIATAAKSQNLSHVNAWLIDVKKYVKQIERAQVADALEKK